MTHHWLITRFFCGQAGDSAHIAARMDLFERVTLPSVRSQTVRDFRWLGVVDSRLPAVRDRLHGFGIETVTADEYSRPVICRAIEGRLSRENADWIITSRLDCDDALHERFIETVRASAAERRECLFPSPVMLWSNGLAAVVRRSWSPFISLVEHRDDGFRSAYQIHCGQPHQYATVRMLQSDKPLCLQVVHDRNRSTVAPDDLEWTTLRPGSGFPAALETP